MPVSITLRVAQGIGDIFWIYQKFAPHCDLLNLNIMAVATDRVQQRALGFTKLLPKVGSVSYSIVEPSVYEGIAGARHPMAPILAQPDRTHDYACNRPLEAGIRLEAIDPDYAVEWGVPVYSRPYPMAWDDYQILYISGSKPNFAWSPQMWASLLLRGWESGRRLPVVLFGAPYDEKVLAEARVFLDAGGIQCSTVIGLHPHRAIDVIRKARYFTGYQSGMNILADNFGVPQTMIYFPQHRAMLNSWCRPGHAEAGIFNGFTFDQGLDEVAGRLDHLLKPPEPRPDEVELGLGGVVDGPVLLQVPVAGLDE